MLMFLGFFASARAPSISRRWFLNALGILYRILAWLNGISDNDTPISIYMHATFQRHLFALQFSGVIENQG